MFGWLRRNIRKIELFGIGVELHPPTETTENLSPNEATAVEILLQLQRKFGQRLRPTLKSVKFCQEGGRCYLRMTASETVAGYLQNELIKQDDLGFIADDKSSDGLYFSPNVPIAENVRRFLQEFDDVSIINCTDLFTEEAAKKADISFRDPQQGSN